MKKLKYTLLLLVTVLTGLSSCSKEDDLLSNQNISAEPVIKVSTTGYESAAPTTRATDNEDEFKTTLAENDRIGIYAVKKDRVISKNVPYKYNSGQWVKDSETAVSLVTGDGVSYFAYYPYRQEMDDKTITSIGNIIGNFEVAADQGSHDLYTKNDLMTAEGSLNQSANTLSFTLKHALALIVVDLKGQRTPYKGGYTVYGAVPKVDKMHIGNVTKPYTDVKGCFRALVKPGAGSVTPDISYVAGGKTVTYNKAITATAGKYSKKLIYAGNTTETEKEFKYGDYFYADGNISSTYTKDANNPCIGIVLSVEKELEHAPYNHGLVVALLDSEQLFYPPNVKTGNLPSVPSSCKNWFLPSIEQLKLMIWGDGNTEGFAGKKSLEDKMKVIDQKDYEVINARPHAQNVFASSTSTDGLSKYWALKMGEEAKAVVWTVNRLEVNCNGRAILAF